MTAQARPAAAPAGDAELARLCALRDPVALRQVITANNQRARYYEITTSGRRQLGEQEAGFAELMAAVRRIMRPA